MKPSDKTLTFLYRLLNHLSEAEGLYSHLNVDITDNAYSISVVRKSNNSVWHIVIKQVPMCYRYTAYFNINGVTVNVVNPDTATYQELLTYY